jgi:hypothetical protein
MRLLEGHKSSPPTVSTHHYITQSRSIAAAAEYEPNRHDEAMLVVRSVPVDPYRLWLDQREADRRAAAMAEPTR